MTVLDLLEVTDCNIKIFQHGVVVLSIINGNPYTEDMLSKKMKNAKIIKIRHQGVFDGLNVEISSFEKGEEND